MSGQATRDHGGQFRGHQWAETVAISGQFRGRLRAVFHGRRHAAAAQLGTAFLLCPEAGTSPAHREVLHRGAAPTALTRAFTGRTARGVSNRFLREHTHYAPSAYPEIHHLTAPLRSAARAEGDADGMHLWAGQAYPLAEPTPAAELVLKLAADARDTLQTAAERIKTWD